MTADLSRLADSIGDELDALATSALLKDHVPRAEPSASAKSPKDKTRKKKKKRKKKTPKGDPPTAASTTIDPPTVVAVQEGPPPPPAGGASSPRRPPPPPAAATPRGRAKQAAEGEGASAASALSLPVHGSADSSSGGRDSNVASSKESKASSGADRVRWRTVTIQKSASPPASGKTPIAVGKDPLRNHRPALRSAKTAPSPTSAAAGLATSSPRAGGLANPPSVAVPSSSGSAAGLTRAKSDSFYDGVSPKGDSTSDNVRKVARRSRLVAVSNNERYLKSALDRRYAEREKLEETVKEAKDKLKKNNTAIRVLERRLGVPDTSKNLDSPAVSPTGRSPRAFGFSPRQGSRNNSQMLISPLHTSPPSPNKPGGDGPSTPANPNKLAQATTSGGVGVPNANNQPIQGGMPQGMWPIPQMPFPGMQAPPSGDPKDAAQAAAMYFNPWMYHPAAMFQAPWMPPAAAAWMRSVQEAAGENLPQVVGRSKPRSRSLDDNDIPANLWQKFPLTNASERERNAEAEYYARRNRTSSIRRSGKPVGSLSAEPTPSPRRAAPGNGKAPPKKKPTSPRRNKFKVLQDWDAKRARAWPEQRIQGQPTPQYLADDEKEEARGPKKKMLVLLSAGWFETQAHIAAEKISNTILNSPEHMEIFDIVLQPKGNKSKEGPAAAIPPEDLEAWRDKFLIDLKRLNKIGGRVFICLEGNVVDISQDQRWEIEEIGRRGLLDYVRVIVLQKSKDRAEQAKNVWRRGQESPLLLGVAIERFLAGNVWKGIHNLIDRMNSYYSTNGTKMCQLARDNKLSALQAMLDAGRNPDAKDRSGDTPLGLACRKGWVKMVKILVQAGSNVETTNKSSKTPLLVATGQGATEIVRFLISAGANIEAREYAVNGLKHTPGARDTSYGRTALIVAAEIGQPEIVKMLVEARADVNARAKNDMTALMLAARDGGGRQRGTNHSKMSMRYVQVVKTLLKADADVDARSTDGDTALTLACENGAGRGGNKAVVKALVEAGASVDVRNREGRTAMRIASNRSSTSILRVLQSTRPKKRPPSQPHLHEDSEREPRRESTRSNASKNGSRRGVDMSATGRAAGFFDVDPRESRR